MHLLPRAVPRGAAWLMVDQLLSMGSNLVVTVALVRRGNEALGSFAGVAAILTVVLALQRALVSEPAAAARRPTRDADDTVTASSLIVLTCGLAVAVVLVVVGVLGVPVLLPLGVALPLLLLQDNTRYMASRTGRPTVAVAMDGLWLGGLLVVLVAVPGAGSSAVVWAWAMCGGLSVVAGLGLLRSGWSGAGLRSPWGWWRRECAAVARATGLDMVLSQAFAQGTVFVVIAYLGLGAAGEYRAAQSLFGGCLAAMIALNMYALPRMRERGSSLRVVAWLGSRYLAVVAAVGAMTLLVNRPAQELVFGRVVVDVPLALATYALFVAMGLSSSQAVALRVDATSRQRLLLRSRSVMLVAGTAATVLGTRSGSVAWVVVAQAAGVGLFVVLTYAGLRSTPGPGAATPVRRALSPFAVHVAASGTPLLDVLYCATRGLSSNRPDAATDLVVEGFPRSANTYVKAAFLHANPSARVASHLHSARSVQRAVRLRIPTVVLVRDPLDAVASLLVRDPRVTARRALTTYLAFYGGVTPVADDVVIVEFDEATRTLGQVIERVNQRFHCEFAVYQPDEPTERLVAAEVERMERDFAGGVVDELAVARPSDARLDQTRAMRDKLLERPNANLLAQCRAAHAAVLAQGRKVTVR